MSSPIPEDTSIGASYIWRISEQRLYAPIEFAHIVGLKTPTILKKCREGKIVASKIGTMWRITGAEIRRYLKEGDFKVV